jgi:ABC-type glycerol-3-phosphate transport system substrate-binding protein
MPLKPPSGTFPLLRRFLVCSSIIVSLGAARAETTVEIVHYFNVPGQLDGLAGIQKDFEAANPDIKIKLTYIPFADLVKTTLQMAQVHKPPGISCIDNPGRSIPLPKGRRFTGYQSAATAWLFFPIRRC